MAGLKPARPHGKTLAQKQEDLGLAFMALSLGHSVFVTGWTPDPVSGLQIGTSPPPLTCPPELCVV